MSPSTFINEIEQAISTGTAERRARMLHRITDLFVFGAGQYTDDHIALLDGVFVHLIADIEVSARAELAGRLAPIPNAPPMVIRTLAFDNSIEVAGPVLAQSSRLDNATLVENASTKSQMHLLAISKRKVLAEAVTDVLVERGNREVALSTVRNAGAKLSESGYVRLVKRSEGDDEFVQSVGSRSEIPRQHFLKLLAKASQAVRHKLEEAHPEHAGEIKRVVAEAATGIQVRVAAESRSYHAARASVGLLHASGRLGEAEIEGFARAKEFEQTTVALSVLYKLPLSMVEHAMAQERPEMILIIAKASGMSWLTVKPILLLRSGEGGMSAHALEQCMAGFARLKRETAQQVIDFQCKQHKAE